jgi:hypothetical protein
MTPEGHRQAARRHLVKMHAALPMDDEGSGYAWRMAHVLAHIEGWLTSQAAPGSGGAVELAEATRGILDGLAEIRLRENSLVEG